MSRLIKASIDVTKIKKEAIFEGKNGAKYINLDIWINDEVDQYGNISGIKQSCKVGDKYESHFIGNGKDLKTTTPAPAPQPVQQQVPGLQDDLPF